MTTSTIFEEALGLVRNKTSVSYSLVSSIVIFTYDVILTFPAELEFVWSKDIHDLSSVLYIIQRYVPILNFIALLFFDSVFLPSKIFSSTTCLVLYNVSGLAYIVGLGVTEVIATLCIMPFWKNNKGVKLTMPVLFLISWIPSLFIFINIDPSTTVNLFSIPITRCSIPNGSLPLILSWGFLVYYQTIGLILILVARHRSARRSHSPYNWLPSLTRIFDDGTVYHLLRVAISVTNTGIIIAIARLSHSAELERAVIPFQQALETVVISRGILECRRRMCHRTSGATQKSIASLDHAPDIEKSTMRDDYVSFHAPIMESGSQSGEDNEELQNFDERESRDLGILIHSFDANPRLSIIQSTSQEEDMIRRSLRLSHISAMPVASSTSTFTVGEDDLLGPYEVDTGLDNGMRASLALGAESYITAASHRSSADEHLTRQSRAPSTSPLPELSPEPSGSVVNQGNSSRSTMDSDYSYETLPSYRTRVSGSTSHNSLLALPRRLPPLPALFDLNGLGIARQCSASSAATNDTLPSYRSS